MDNFENPEWEEKLPAFDYAAEMKKIRKSLRRRNALVVLTSLVLVAVLILGVVFVAIPMAENSYWNPNQNTHDLEYCTDLSLALMAYSELFTPGLVVSNVNARLTGFASYDLSVQMWKNYSLYDITYRDATLELGKLNFSDGFWEYSSANIFERATIPFYYMDGDFDQRTLERLSVLPEYVEVLAAVSFPEDLTMEELIALQEQLGDDHIVWAGIRRCGDDRQRYPLAGIKPFIGGLVMDSVNEYYPYFDVKSQRTTPEALEQHFQSLLQYLVDFTETNGAIGYETGETYRETLDYVAEHGVHSYGAFIIGSPQTFLELWENGTASQIWIQDAWIGA